jgi:hypothetical protein
VGEAAESIRYSKHPHPLTPSRKGRGTVLQNAGVAFLSLLRSTPCNRVGTEECRMARHEEVCDAKKTKSSGVTQRRS